MKEIILNKNHYDSYKDFYNDLTSKLDKSRFNDWDWCDQLDGGILDEFLWYCHNDSIKYIFVNFDKEKIKLQKKYEDYEYNIVLTIFERFVEEYPNNKLEFRMEDDKN